MELSLLNATFGLLTAQPTRGWAVVAELRLWGRIGTRESRQPRSWTAQSVDAALPESQRGIRVGVEEECIAGRMPS